MKARRAAALTMTLLLAVCFTSGPTPLRRQPLSADERLFRLIQELWAPDDLAGMLAAESLGRSRDIRAADALFRVSKDTSFEVRARAVQGLGHVRDPRATEVLLAAMRDSRTQFMAARSLRQLRDPRALDALLTLRGDPDSNVRAMAVMALGSLRDPRAFDAVRSALKDADESVRQHAVRSIEVRTDPAAVEALAGALDRAPDAGRALIARIEDTASDAIVTGLLSSDERVWSGALDAFSHPTNINSKHVPAMVRRLCAALDNGSEAVRQRSAMALGQIGDVRAVDPLLKELANPAWFVRLSALRALAKLNDDRAFNAILALAWNRSSDLHREALLTLMELQDPRSLDALLSALDETSSINRDFAAAGLARMADPRAVAGLAAASTKSGSSMIEALQRSRQPSAATALAAILDKSPSDAPIAAAAEKALGEIANILRAELRENPEAQNEWRTALNRIRSPRAAQILIAGLTNDKDLAWVPSVFTLDRFYEDRTVETLVAALGDPGYGERRRRASLQSVPALIKALNDMEDADHAALALGRIGDRRAVDPLRAIMRKYPKFGGAQLEHELVWTQANAAWALGRIGDRSALPELLRSLASLSPKVARSAAVVLAAWKERRAVDALLLALEHENSAVRDGAALALGEIGDAHAIPALVPCLMDPEIAGTVAKALSNLNWSPQADRERVYYLAAQGKWDAIAARRETSVRILREDLSQNIPGVSEGAAYILVAMGAGDAIPELIPSLKQIGSEEMARVYWNSGHPDLQTAAAQWSVDNGIELLDLQIWDFPVVHWAGRDLSPVRFNPQLLEG